MQSREETHVSQIVSTPESRAKAQRIADADMKNLVQWQTPEQVLKSRADRCTTHHYACDCREYRAQQDREKLAMWERLMPEIRCALTQRILQGGIEVSEQYGLVLGEINAMYGERND